MTNKREHERQEEAKEKESHPSELARRRASLIAEFQVYIQVTFGELSLASHEETEALRSPLLQMKLTEEDIGAWETFRAFLPKLLNAAQELHAKIDDLLQQAADDRLLDSNDIAAWHAFFRSASIDFQEKKRGAEELARNLSVQKMQHTDEHRPKEKQEPPSEPSIMKKDQDVERDQDVEQKSQETEKQEEEESFSPLRSTQLHTRLLLTLLPSQIAPLYTAAAERGSFALHAVQKTLERSLIRQNFGFRHRKGTVILTAEKLRNTEGSLATCQASATQNEEAPTVILEPISLQTQSAVVHGIHKNLHKNICTLERHGIRF